MGQESGLEEMTGHIGGKERRGVRRLRESKISILSSLPKLFGVASASGSASVS